VIHCVALSLPTRETVNPDFEVGKLRTSVGTGIRLTLPILGQTPIAIDLAVPLTKDGKDETQVDQLLTRFQQVNRRWGIFGVSKHKWCICRYMGYRKRCFSRQLFLLRRIELVALAPYFLHIEGRRIN